MPKKCYMCDRDAVSREHVPPRCLFPETEDLIAMGITDINLRVNLVTVPSCAEHNMSTSKDDEYFLFVMAMNHTTNNIGGVQILTRIRSAYEQRPTLIDGMLASATPAVIRDEKGLFETGAIPLQMERINRVLDKIARALYFHHTKDKWMGRTYSIIEFMDIIGSENEEAKSLIASIRVVAERDMGSLEKHGSNPDVFWYSILEGVKGVRAR